MTHWRAEKEAIVHDLWIQSLSMDSSFNQFNNVFKEYEKLVREEIAQAIENFADAGYQGAATTDDATVLATSEYIKTALLNAAAMARDSK